MGHTGPRVHEEPRQAGWQFLNSSDMWVFRTHKGANGGACFQSKVSGLWWATGGIVGIGWESFATFGEAQAHAVSVKLVHPPVQLPRYFNKNDRKGRNNGYGHFPEKTQAV